MGEAGGQGDEGEGGSAAHQTVEALALLTDVALLLEGARGDHAALALRAARQLRRLGD